MNVTIKAYRIWRILFNSPNTWIPLNEIAFDTGMTIRQVSSVVQTMNSPNILRDNNECVKPSVMLECDDNELKELRRLVITTYNKIDDEVFDSIRDTLSPVGWTTAQDLAIMTGYANNKINLAVSLMDDVKTSGRGKTKLYMLE